MIELAPQHKTGLSLKSPIMPASGCAGFASEYAALIDWSKWGAFVTNPVTARPPGMSAVCSPPARHPEEVR